jgi:hypothetical protein
MARSSSSVAILAVIPGRDEVANPESIVPHLSSGEMDSGFAQVRAPE